MIRLTRLNNHALILNSDLIKSIEAAPDTVLTLVNSEKIIVRESAEEVLERVIEFRRSLLGCAPRIEPRPATDETDESSGTSAQGGEKPDGPAGSGS